MARFRHLFVQFSMFDFIFVYFMFVYFVCTFYICMFYVYMFSLYMCIFVYFIRYLYALYLYIMFVYFMCGSSISIALTLHFLILPTQPHQHPFKPSLYVQGKMTNLNHITIIAIYDENILSIFAEIV